MWGWWAKGRPDFPCLLWCSERGWSAAVVEPECASADGYELSEWRRRIDLLERALQGAPGPHPSLGMLELQLVLSPNEHGAREALLWGIVHLRAAQQRAIRGAPPKREEDGRSVGTWVDGELTRLGLTPTMFKARSAGRVGTNHRTPTAESPGQQPAPAHRSTGLS